MSLETWKKEFLGSLKHVKKMSWIVAFKHSIRKWSGLTKKNLRKHSLTQAGHMLFDNDGSVFYVSSSTCALCIKSCNSCYICPLR